MLVRWLICVQHNAIISSIKEKLSDWRLYLLDISYRMIRKASGIGYDFWFDFEKVKKWKLWYLYKSKAYWCSTYGHFMMVW
jgi:hypothetical protein